MKGCSPPNRLSPPGLPSRSTFAMALAAAAVLTVAASASAASRPMFRRSAAAVAASSSTAATTAPAFAGVVPFPPSRASSSAVSIGAGRYVAYSSAGAVAIEDRRCRGRLRGLRRGYPDRGPRPSHASLTAQAGEGGRSDGTTGTASTTTATDLYDEDNHAVVAHVVPRKFVPIPFQVRPVSPATWSVLGPCAARL